MNKLCIKGFTLMELSIALVVIVIALGGLIGIITTCLAVNESAGDLTVAINDAQCVMEEIRGHNIPSSITTQDWTVWAQTDFSDGGGSCNSLDGETVEVTYPAGTEATPLEILVTVSWQERGREKTIQLVTLFTER